MSEPDRLAVTGAAPLIPAMSAFTVLVESVVNGTITGVPFTETLVTSQE